MPTTPPHCIRREPRNSASERGIVMLYAVIGLVIVLSIVLSGTRSHDASEDLVHTVVDAHSHARKAAESGLVDTISWLRRQYDQPVDAITPRRDLTVDPPVDETDDPGVGLVREFEISPGYWARYVVRSGTKSEPFTDVNDNGYYDPDEPFEDLDGNGERTMGRGCQDLSELRGAYRSGIVWYLESEGSIYRRPWADQPLGEGHNTRLAYAVLGTEARRLAYVLPASAALVGAKPDDIKLEGAIFESPLLGVAHRPDNNKSPSYTTQMHKKEHCEFEAPLDVNPVAGWEPEDGEPFDITCRDVFGVSIGTLRAMADYKARLVSKLPKKDDSLDEYVFGEATDELPVTIPQDALVVITPSGGKLKVDKNESIIGQGIMVIDGDMEVKDDSEIQFSGILFVTGNLKVERTGAFEGIVIVGKKIEIKGELPTVKYKKSGRKKKSKKSWKSHKSKKSKKSVKYKPDRSVWFGHNPELVKSLLKKLGNYRQFRASFQPVPLAPDGRPDEAVGTKESLLIAGQEK